MLFRSDVTETMSLSNLVGEVYNLYRVWNYLNSPCPRSTAVSEVTLNLKRCFGSQIKTRILISYRCVTLDEMRWIWDNGSLESGNFEEKS